MNEFDARASNWDANPVHWERSKAIATEIVAVLPENKQLTAIDFGAGTGILSHLLSRHFKQVTLIDSSTEMLKVASQKMEQEGLSNLSVLPVNLETEPYTGEPVDCLFTQMVMHHIDDTDAMLHTFNRLLKPGGLLMIADLYQEDGSFHSGEFHGHNGFDTEALQLQLKQAGFEPTGLKTCFIMRRTAGDVERQYPVFFSVSKKISV